MRRVQIDHRLVKAGEPFDLDETDQILHAEWDPRSNGAHLVILKILKTDPPLGWIAE